MNIFFLDRNTKTAAQYHVDKHVVKMILESCQLLSTAHRILDGRQSQGLSKSGRNVKRWVLSDPEKDRVLYIAGHVNHPSAVWVRQNQKHYHWLVNLAQELIAEYKHRYDGKAHKCETLIPYLLEAPRNIADVPWSDPPQAMPDDCKADDSVVAYRNYYMQHKRQMANWKIRGAPNWYK